MADAKQKQEYIAQAEHAWETAWDILHDDDGWTAYSGSGLATGIVSYRSHSDFGTVYKLEAYLKMSPEVAMEYLMLLSDESRANVKRWSSTMDRVERLEVITDNIDIDYSLVTPPLKIVSQRDFVNVRHWKTEDEETLIVMQGTVHPSKPPTDDPVRGHQKLGAMLFVPMDDDPNKTLFKWTMNPKFGGNVPQFMAEKALAGGLLTDLKSIQELANQ